VFGEAVPRQTVDSFDSLTPVADVKRGERSSEEKTESVMSEIAYGRFERDFTTAPDTTQLHASAPSH
jgi:HSP20 family molecular chaperone IbpA